MQESHVTRHLLPNEKVLWSGRPVQGLMLTPQDAILVPALACWCAFFIPDTSQVLRGPGVFSGQMLTLLPFLLLGAYGLVGRFFVDAWERRRLFYAVTDTRVILLRQKPFAKFTSINLTSLPEMSFRESKSGKGTIVFGESGWRWSRDDGANAAAPPKFVGIDNVHAVFNSIQAAAFQRSR